MARQKSNNQYKKQGQGLSKEFNLILNSFQNKYTSLDNYQVIAQIHLAVQSKTTKLTNFLKEIEFYEEKEIMEKYYQIDSCKEQIDELTEYYKYYTQTSINYQPSFNKIMFNNRQRKKVIEYNRLKILLNLSASKARQETFNQSKNDTPSTQFRLPTQLNDNQASEESLLFKNLTTKFQSLLGSNCFHSIEQLDKVFFFKKKPEELSCDQLENKKKKREHKRVWNSKKHRMYSCQSRQSIEKSFERKMIRNSKKHRSMDMINFAPHIFEKQISKQKDKNTSTGHFIDMKNYTNSQKKIKEVIIRMKQKIVKQKEVMKKKIMYKSNQNQNIKYKKHIETKIFKKKVFKLF